MTSAPRTLEELEAARAERLREEREREQQRRDEQLKDSVAFTRLATAVALYLGGKSRRTFLRDMFEAAIQRFHKELRDNLLKEATPTTKRGAR